MKKVSVFVDGYNLYHAIDNLGDNSLKWTNLISLSEQFIQLQDEEILRLLFFTAFPSHKPLDVQKRYSAYTEALNAIGVQVIEGKFKKKFFNAFDKHGIFQQRETFEEKETDVNIALRIVEDAYEKISDKILLISNDSDISPALSMAREKNKNLKINVITPPLPQGRKANFDLMNSSGNMNKNRRGQTFFKTRMIKALHLERNRLPEEITKPDGSKIIMPNEYK